MKHDNRLNLFKKSAVITALLCAVPPAQPAWGGDEPDSYSMGAGYDKDTKAGKPNFDKYFRHNEDWSDFVPNNEGGAVQNFFDSLKRIDLNDDGSVWLSVGGSARARYEHYENYKFSGKYDDGFLVTRFRLHGDLKVGDQFRAFVEGKSAFSTERALSGGQRTSDTDELALQQAFADLIFDIGEENTLTIRSGRQRLLFGKQRLVSPDDWSNSMRAWDGVSAILSHGDWTTQAFWTQFVPVQKYDFNTSDAQTQFFGVYATGPVCDEYGVSADIYFLGLDQSDSTNTFNGTTGAERRYTVGGRLFGEVPDSGLDYDFEAAYQFGDLGAGSISAWMFATEVGYTLDKKTALRPFVGFDYASGDRSSGGDVETFNQLFPLAHNYDGYADHVGRQNIIDVNAGVSFKPVKKLTARVAGHLFWRASDNDALYNASGSVLLAGGLATDRFVGSEIDVTLKYKLNDYTYLMFGYSRFFTGDFIKTAAPTESDNIDTVKFQIERLF